MSEREELAELLKAERWTRVTFTDEDGRPDYGVFEQSNADVADAIIAAGYRKPRTITTAEELDALRNGSIILEIDGTPTRAIKRQDGNNWWIDSPRGMSGSALIPLPVTVLWEPRP